MNGTVYYGASRWNDTDDDDNSPDSNSIIPPDSNSPDSLF